MMKSFWQTTSVIDSLPGSAESQRKETRLIFRLPKRIDVISGCVEATLIFALCASFSGTLFSEESGLKGFAALCMQSHLLTATVAGLCQHKYTSLDLSLAAPDIVPTLVLSNLLTVSSLGKVPSIGTSLAIIWICTILTGIGCIVLGRTGLSSGANNKMPEFVFNGFVVVAGLLILSKSIKMSMPKRIYDEGPFQGGDTAGQYFMFFLCSLPHGIGMYVQKRFNFSPADIVLPVIIISPLVVFVVLSVLAWGWNDWITRARETGWMLEPRAASPFYEPFTTLYFGETDWFEAVTSAPIMLILSAGFLTGDIFFKTIGTLKLLDPKASIDKEMILAGWINIVSGLLCGVPGYSQMKLAAINIGVVGKQSTSRMPSLICSVILGVLFISAVPLVEYVPRFWLSGILFNVAIGFIVEGFWDPPMSPRQRGYIILMILAFYARSHMESLMSYPISSQ